MSKLWERRGGAAGGAVVDLAVSPSFARDQTAFAATLTGLHRSRDGGHTWRRIGLGNVDAPIAAVAVSPSFDSDGLVLAAGLSGAPYRVTGDGTMWRAGNLTNQTVQVAALAVSPHLAYDGVAFAATMGDGVLVSRDGGARWEACTFGLLDLDVHALAISPQYERDEMVCAATSTGVYRSQNGGRAWRESAPPAGSAIVHCLAIAPDVGAGVALFAGTDGAGIYRSLDRGRSWQPCGDAPRDACINGLVLSPTFVEDRAMMAITESAVYLSRDAGERWVCQGQVPDALCLAMAAPGGPAFVGLSRGGVWRATGDLSRWEPAAGNVAARRLTGLALSPTGTRAAAPGMVTFGQGEGVFYSPDGGKTWAEDAGLPSSDVADMALSLRPDGTVGLYAALPEGVWWRRWDAVTWEQVDERPARLLALPPLTTPSSLAVMAGDDGTLSFSRDGLRHWQRVDVPWRRREILVMSVAPGGEGKGAGHIFVATGDPDGPRVEVWHGTAEGRWIRVAEHEGVVRRAVIALPASAPWDGTWYAAIGAQVYGPLVVSSRHPPGRQATGQAVASERLIILDLALLPGSFGLVAATDRGMYHLASHGRDWQSLGNGDGPWLVVAVVTAADGSVYALEPGGCVWRLRQPL